MRRKKLILFVLLLGLLGWVFRQEIDDFVVGAVSSWQEVDLNNDGQVNSVDVNEALTYLGCPLFGSCLGSGPTPPPSGPPPTKPPGGWSACGVVHFGTQLIGPESVNFIRNIKAWPGFVFSGAVQRAAEVYPELSGWTRGLGGGNLQQITNKHASAGVFGIADDYECLVYGPESGHTAGDEAINPDTNIVLAENLAEQAGKCLLYAPSVNDYEENIPNLRGIATEDMISQVAPHVDIWGIQLGQRQGAVDWDKSTEDEFIAWLAEWVNRIKSANPSTRILAQVGISKHDKITNQCLPALPPEYILEWRERLVGLVEGIVMMPSQLCENDPLYPTYFVSAEDAVRMVCE